MNHKTKVLNEMKFMKFNSEKFEIEKIETTNI